MDLGLTGRTALVTGASSGLGLASARSLAAEGVAVVMASRSADALDAAVASVADDATGARPTAIPADLAEPSSIAALVDAAVAEVGPLDIVIANAGGPPAGGFADTSLDAYGPALQLNLLASIDLCQRTIPAMRERGWGRVVAITSMTVRQPSPTLILSNTARTGLTSFLKTTALEVAADGVTVNSVLPGLHATPRLEHLGATPEQLAASVPMPEIGRAADFGDVVAFVCSDQARYITGATIPVDGGQVVGLP
ncbi:MAG: SDR family oxidoreductase [Acidimicrobiales bacterium]